VLVELSVPGCANGRVGRSIPLPPVHGRRCWRSLDRDMGGGRFLSGSQAFDQREGRGLEPSQRPLDEPWLQGEPTKDIRADVRYVTARGGCPS
jgi:hypothetical protein